MKFNPNAFEILQERGFVMLTSHEQEIKKTLKEKPITFYLGIDPTADDLHIGHFFALQMFKILQDCGHKGILLIGGATAMVGDPSFKNDMRSMLTKEQIDRNSKEISGILHRFIDAKNAIIVNNADWIRPKGYIDFMREVGAHFNVAKMLSAECYKNRIKEGGLTFLEMGYMLMQAYDFVHLNDKYNCIFQIGGSDQWGNILAGTELGRKMSLRVADAAKQSLTEHQRPTMFGLCCPLLTKSDGTKMGKTEKGVLWVNRDKTSVYDCFQYFFNIDDADVERLLRFFTMLPISEIVQLCKTDIVAAKKLMAFEVTKKIHGEQAAAEARETAQRLFSGAAQTDTAPTETISLASLRGAAGNAAIPTQGTDAAIPLVDILALTSIIKSKREARELIESGAIQIDGKKITDINATINKKEFLVKKGKKTFLKITIKQ